MAKYKVGSTQSYGCAEYLYYKEDEEPFSSFFTYTGDNVLGKRRIDITGEKYGRFTVLKEVEERAS